MVFPTIQTKTLDGKSIQLPTTKPKQLYILGFSQDSGKGMELWVNKLGITYLNDHWDWYQIAVIGGVPPFVDGIIKNSIKKTMPKSIQPRFIPYFGNRFKFTEPLFPDGLDDEDTPVLVLVSEDGNIEWIHQATPSTKNIQLLHAQLK